MLEWNWAETTKRAGSLSMSRGRTRFRVLEDAKENMHVWITDYWPWHFFGIHGIAPCWGCSNWFSNVGSSNLTVLTVCLMVCCMFVLTANLSKFVWLEPTEACSADDTAKYLLFKCFGQTISQLLEFYMSYSSVDCPRPRTRPLRFLAQLQTQTSYVRLFAE